MRQMFFCRADVCFDTIFKGIKTPDDIQKWLDNFQADVNDIAGNEFLKFTAVVWDPDNSHPGWSTSTSTIDQNPFFPFLDMQLSWSENGDLTFGVFIKPNQQLKYLNKGSSHTPGCFKAIPKGVLHRLTKLTTINDDNKGKRIDEIYPVYITALTKSELVKTDDLPTLGDLQTEREKELADTTTQAIKKQRQRDRKRAIYFKIGFSNYWGKPIHKLIKDIKKKFPSLSWLRVSMSYHRFVNLRELFQGDLNAKISEGIKSLDFENLDCNCKKPENCPYKGKCRRAIVVYKATCLKTGKQYIGNTQQYVKKRIQQHVQDVKNLVLNEKNSDSFASHFAGLVPPNTTRKDIKNHIAIKIDLLWQGQALSTVKAF